MLDFNQLEKEYKETIENLPYEKLILEKRTYHALYNNFRRKKRKGEIIDDARMRQARTYISLIDRRLIYLKQKKIRPYELIQTERYNKKTLLLFEQEDLKVFVESNKYDDKQLGRLKYTYGFIIDRLEQYLHVGNYDVITAKNKTGEITGESIQIVDKWANFSSLFPENDKKHIWESLEKNLFQNIIMTYKEGDKIFYETSTFITCETKGEIVDINSAPEYFKNQIKKLKQYDQLLLFDSVQIKKKPEFIKININKAFYANAIKYLKGAKGERLLPGYSSVYEMPANLPTKIKNEIDSLNDFMPVKIYYTDNYRVLAEIILTHMHNRNDNKKLVTNESIIPAEKWFNFIFPGHDKRNKLRDTVEVMLIVLKNVFNNKCYIDFYKNIILLDNWDIKLDLSK